MRVLILATLLLIISCDSSTTKEDNHFGDLELPYDEPLVFMPNLIEKNKLIHRGIFSPDHEIYFYTESLKDFTNFNVKQIQKTANGWSKPKDAFFNSAFDEHGMSFSPDGNHLYFSSTRPTNIEEIPFSWHIWRSEKVNNVWNEPSLVDIPNMKDRLLSHPTITNSGRIYFHASNLDYSNMNIYYSIQEDGKFSDAVLVNFDEKIGLQKCTPFISSNENYIVFAEITEEDLILKISFKESENKWSKPKELDQKINTLGRGNPFISNNEEFLFFSRKEYQGKDQEETWNIYWVDIKEALIN